MQCIKILAGVCASLDQIQRNFLWGGNNENRKLALVKWSSICTPKAHGGLGIRDTRSMNKALLAKRRWQLCSKSDSLWSNILKAKYLINGILLQAEKKNDSSYTWKSILSAQDCVKKGVIDQKLVRCFKTSLKSCLVLKSNRVLKFILASAQGLL